MHSEMLLNLLKLPALLGTKTTWQLAKYRLPNDISALRTKEKDLDRIFEPLYTTKMQGTGLGLAGCKNIIQSHKGSITVSINPVKFTIKIPKSL